MNSSGYNLTGILSIQDEQLDFFPSEPLPGAMKMFKPLLEVMKECIGNHPVAYAENVEKKLKEQYPDSISKMNLISFAEYVYLARQRGLPIRCSQSCGKPVFLWFSLLEEAKSSTTNDNDQVNQNGILHQSTSQLFDTQTISDLNSSSSKDSFDSSSSATNSANRFTQLSSSSPQIVGRRFVTLRGSTSELKQQSFELISRSSSKRARVDEYKDKNIDNQTQTILNAMFRKKIKFCLDRTLFKFVGILINFVLSNPGHTSIISANWVYNFIQRKFPTFLGSPQDSLSTKENAYNALLGQANYQEWEMPIVFMRRRNEINTDKLHRLIDLYKKDV